MNNSLWNFLFSADFLGHKAVAHVASSQQEQVLRYERCFRRIWRAFEERIGQAVGTAERRSIDYIRRVDEELRR